MLRLLKTFCVIAGSTLALGGCFTPMKPSEGHVSRPSTTMAPTPSANIPAPVQGVPMPPPPTPAAKQETFSVVVNNIPAQELLFILARDAKLNVDVHPGISGTVTLNAIDQTLTQLLDRIARQIDMRYELNGANLTVMPDTPFLRLYKIDYVNMERSMSGTVSVSTNILSTGAAGMGGTGANAASATPGSQNASTMAVQNVTRNRFWVTLEENIKAILRETDKVLPTGPAAAPSAPGTAPAAPTVTFREAASVIANPETGIVTVRASGRQHEKIQEFLDQVLSSAKRQVLIEATIVEVRLSQAYQQGIDWGIFGSSGFRLFQGGLYRGQTVPPVTTGILPGEPTSNLLAGQYNSQDFRATVRLLETFGNLRVLSSPRIAVLNNQTAVLKVVDNLVYFTVSGETSQSESSVVSTFTTTPQSVSVGFIMNVTPQIDGADMVLLNLKPTISRLIRFVQDPNPALANPCGNNPNCNVAPIVSGIPEIRQRELESVMRVRSGDIAVMGGLIEDQVDSNEDTVPGINRIPLIGDALSNKNQANAKTELVIFLRPQVIKEASVDGDYRGYRIFLPGDDFTRQPHPGRVGVTLGEGVR